MSAPNELVFLLDVDNTLLNNDRVLEDFRAHLILQFGANSAARYWEIFQERMDELGYADYLGALQTFRWSSPEAERDDLRMLQLGSFLLEYPFAERLYLHALDVVARLNSLGTTVILTDGDSVFQPRKVQRSGLWDAVSGRVLVYIHKEQMLDAVQRHYPARHYVMVDDKLRLLTAMKSVMQQRLTTVFPRQGRFALDTAAIAAFPAADIQIERINELLELDFSGLLGPGLTLIQSC